MNLRDIMHGDATVAAEDPVNQHYHDEFESSNQSSQSKQHHRWYIPLLLFVLVGAEMPGS